jgi:Holliday junction resolvase RusA-like endonuclease
VKILNFNIPGKPIAKKRPRFARRGKFVATYNDQETEESKFMHLVIEQLPEGHKPAAGPVILSAEWYLPRPKSHYRTNGDLKPWARNLKHIKKPDKDNLEKFLKDCCNGIVWVDDSQVYESYGTKRYAGGAPRTVFSVTIED